MNTAELIAIDTHTHLEVSCRNPFDSYGEEYDRLPTIRETAPAPMRIGRRRKPVCI